MSIDQHERTDRALNRVAKWRALFAGWHLGTRPKGDPESDAMRDLRELTILMRVELNALTKAMLDSGTLTRLQFQRLLEEEADAYSAMLEEKFPGVKATDHGLEIDAARATFMRGWKP